MATKKGGLRSTSAAIARVQRLEADRNVAGLIVELENPDARGRYSIVPGHAARALGRVGDAHAVPYLIDLFSDESDQVRADVLFALGMIATAECVSTLERGLNDSAPLVRAVAAEGLGKMKAFEAADVLMRVVTSDDDRYARLHAAEALVEIGDASVAPLIPGVIAALPWRVRRRARWRRLQEHGMNL